MLTSAVCVFGFRLHGISFCMFVFGYIFRIITNELRTLDYAKKYLTRQVEQFVLVDMAFGYIGFIFAGLFFGYIF